MKRVHLILVFAAITVFAATRSFAQDGANPTVEKKTEAADSEPGALIEKLSSDSFRIRENATRGLIRLGKIVIPSVSTATASDDPEVRYRCFLVLVTFLRSDDREVSRLAKDTLRNIAKSDNRAIAMQARKLLRGSLKPTWVAYESKKLKDAIHRRETVLISFRADWCPQCRNIERNVLMSPEFVDLVERNNVTIMVADITDSQSPEGKTLLNELKKLGSNEIPTVAIISAGKSAEPVLLIGRIEKKKLLVALDSAGPSKAAANKE